MAIVDLKNCIITLTDNTTNFLEIHVGEGTIVWTEKREILPVKNRGRLNTIRLGEDQLMDVSFSFIWDFITGSGDIIPTIEDALKRINAASNWVSTSQDPDAPYSVHIQIIDTPICNVQTEQILLANFNYEELAHQIKDGSIACKGVCNSIEAIATRV
jgi:hypothetical protein